MYILAIDQGTTGTTVGLYDIDKKVLLLTINNEFKQILPEAGWVEHDLDDIWGSVKRSVVELLHQSGIDVTQISSIGITNQRETACAFDYSGRPLANAIVWQDKRTHEKCNELKARVGDDYIRTKTGLPFDPYFTATKFSWLLNNSRAVSDAANKNTLRIGTIDTFLVYKLTSCQRFITDTTNASRTQLFDLQAGDWSEELLELFELRREWLPDVVDSIGNLAETNGVDILPSGIPITSILGDQQAALLGQSAISSGDIKITYGTGAFVMANTGPDYICSSGGLLSTVSYSYEGVLNYALEGPCYTAGAAVQWLRDNLGFIESAEEVEELARAVDDLRHIEKLLFYPFLSGIGSPHWKSDATGCILGITRKTDQSQIARVLLEGVALSVNEVLDEFKKELPNFNTHVVIDGGAARNNLLSQMQANFSNLIIKRNHNLESTCLGAAYSSAIGSGVMEFDEVKNISNSYDEFVGVLDKYYENKRTLWKDVLDRIYLN